MIVIERKGGHFWNSLFCSPPSKVCHWGEVLLNFSSYPLPFCLSPCCPIYCPSPPTSPSSPLIPPSLFATTSLSLFPKSFLSSHWFFCLVSLSPFHPFPHIPCLGTFHPFALPPICLSVSLLSGPHGATSAGKPWIYTFIYQSLYQFFHPFHSVFQFIHLFVYSSHRHTWESIM